MLLEGGGEYVTARAIGDEEKFIRLGRIKHRRQGGTARISDRSRGKSVDTIGVVGGLPSEL